MSAQPCGCDLEAAWMCKRHLEERAAKRALAGGSFLKQTIEAAMPSDTLQRFRERLADEHTMRDTTPAVDTPAVRMVNAAVDLLAERKRIAAVLATFYRAELSMSSVQPLLALALELNPELVERTR